MVVNIDGDRFCFNLYINICNREFIVSYNKVKISNFLVGINFPKKVGNYEINNGEKRICDII